MPDPDRAQTASVYRSHRSCAGGEGSWVVWTAAPPHNVCRPPTQGRRTAARLALSIPPVLRRWWMKLRGADGSTPTHRLPPPTQGRRAAARLARPSR